MRVWLKELRLQRGFTHNDVAEESNVKRAYYTMIESGSRNPSVNVAKRIAKTLGFEWTIFFENKCNEMKHKSGSKEVS
ncbi:helix-turn-helix transcriptional regulator [Bacillus sp. PK3_68]|uniref:helix-turn-helix transcriptional regulator n=1 Tax=Bacillus sp. PK3_68 TaxID=2027408 RepID=UPI000E72364F|nr:helix-turn-helix transcriptional regulator [Bacillus sp. PK3_68]RJS60152.1 transcriptional regulator [Bacillus sp. PK3_68]